MEWDAFPSQRAPELGLSEVARKDGAEAVETSRDRFPSRLLERQCEEYR